MARRVHRDKELNELQVLRSENKSLKRQLQKLRKQLDRLDLDRHQNVKELLEEADAKVQELEAVKQNKELEKAWQCWDCFKGTLRITILERRDCTVYWRKCDNCSYRTKTKKYTPDVKES